MSLNYASYNFNSIVQQLRDKLKEKNPVWDNYESSTATMLIELFAYIGEMLMYTAERRAQESYLPTAQLKSSIINLVRLINYRPRRKVSSTGKLTFTIAVAIANNIYIPKYTRCSRSDGAVFLTAADTILFAGSTSVEVDGIQGDIVPLSFISDGTESQEYAIVDDSVENSNLVVTISNAVWTEVSSFVESQSSSLHYRIFVNNDETVSLRFGDNKFGKIPPANVSVGIQYVRSLGGDGNVFSTGVITNILDTIEDELGNVVTLTVTNSTVFLGGDDAETIEEIRYNAPRIFATAERDVTKQDYISDLGNYPSVAAVNVWGEAEENPPNQDMMNKLKIVMLLDDWNLPGTNFKQQISDYLQTRAQVTVQYEFVDPDVVELNAVVKATTTQKDRKSVV